MDNVFFLHQIKRTNGTFEKGIVVKSDPAKDNLSEVKQGYHAYLGAYAYGRDSNTDYVQCMITDIYGMVVGSLSETWIAPEPEED